MTISTKIILFLSGSILLAAITFIVFKQIENSNRQKAIESEIVAQKELSNNVMRALSQYATKQDIDNLAKSANINMSEIKKDLSVLNATVTAINQATSSSQWQHQTGGSSTGTTPNPSPTPIDPSNPDPFGYQKNRQFLDVAEKFDNVMVPFGQVGFSAWQKNPWDYNILPRQYVVTNVIGTDPNQRYYVYNKFSVNVGDKTYDLKISSSKTLEEYPTASWSFFNPRLYLGMDGGINLSSVRGEVSPTLSIGSISYGKFINQPDISVLQVGAGYGIDARKLDFSLTPFMYNIGNHIPLTRNLYTGPSIHINTSGDISLMAGIKVGL